jgi:hypothetical protein
MPVERGPKWTASLAAALPGALAGALAGALVGAAAMFFLSGPLVRSALLARPEIAAEAMQKLQDRDLARVVSANRAALETPYAGAWAGAKDGDVVLVEFFDYACPYCRRTNGDIDRLLREDSRLKLVWRELPVLGPDSEAAAIASLAAARAGRFRLFHDALFAAGRPTPPALGEPTRRGRGDFPQLPACPRDRSHRHPDPRDRRPGAAGRGRLRHAEGSDHRGARGGPEPVTVILSRLVRSGFVEALSSSSSAREKMGFDRLSPNGVSSSIGQNLGAQAPSFAPLNPCATTYHSDEPLRLAGGLACLTEAKRRLSSATRSWSAPPASTLAT